MHKELEAIRAAFDPGDPETKNVKPKRDMDKVRQLADKYVKDHPEEFTELKELSEGDCVRACEVFRAAGLHDSEWRVQAWLFHAFEPQKLTGEYQATLRAPGG